MKLNPCSEMKAVKSGHCVISICLGGSLGPTGLVIVEPKSIYSHPRGDQTRLEWDNHFAVRWLERLPSGCEYLAILSRIRELTSQRRIGRDPSILMDISATGLAAVRFFEDQGYFPIPFRVSDAGASSFQDAVRIVPRKDMITAAQIAIQSSRLQVSTDLELAATLITDLEGFNPEAPAKSQHGDLVIGVAMILWWGERMQWSEEVAEDMLSDGDDLADYDRSDVTGY